MIHRKVFDIITLDSFNTAVKNKGILKIRKKLQTITKIAKELHYKKKGNVLISINLNTIKSYGYDFDGILLSDDKIYATQIDKYFILPISNHNNYFIPDEYVDLYTGQLIDDKIEKLPTICSNNEIKTLLLEILNTYNKDRCSPELMNDILNGIKNLYERVPYYEKLDQELQNQLAQWLLKNYNAKIDEL